MKNKLRPIVPLILLFCCCNGSLKAQSHALQQPSYKSDLRPGQRLPLKKILTDTVAYVDFNDDGDFAICFIKKGNQHLSLIADDLLDEKFEFLRGDTLEIKWRMDSIRVPGDGESLHFTECLTSVRKISNGRIEAFRKSYPKQIKYYYAEDKTYNRDFLDFLYKLMEYYIAYSENDEVKMRRENSGKVNFAYSIEDGQRGDKSYTVLGLAEDVDGHLNYLQWLYLDPEKRILYEYDFDTDKISEFP